MDRKKELTDKKKKNTRFVVVALFLCLAVAFFVSPFASSSPDGLEKAAEKLGFLHLGEVLVWGHSLMPDYSIPWLGEGPISGMIAGLVGTLVIFGLGWGIGAILKKRKSSD
jgi:cobalt/nickel transport protein